MLWLLLLVPVQAYWCPYGTSKCEGVPMKENYYGCFDDEVDAPTDWYGPEQEFLNLRTCAEWIAQSAFAPECFLSSADAEFADLKNTLNCSADQGTSLDQLRSDLFAQKPDGSGGPWQAWTCPDNRLACPQDIFTYVRGFLGCANETDSKQMEDDLSSMDTCQKLLNLRYKYAECILSTEENEFTRGLDNLNCLQSERDILIQARAALLSAGGSGTLASPCQDGVLNSEVCGCGQKVCDDGLVCNVSKLMCSVGKACGEGILHERCDCHGEQCGPLSDPYNTSRDVCGEHRCRLEWCEHTDGLLPNKEKCQCDDTRCKEGDKCKAGEGGECIPTKKSGAGSGEDSVAWIVGLIVGVAFFLFLIWLFVGGGAKHIGYKSLS